MAYLQGRNPFTHPAKMEEEMCEPGPGDGLLNSKKKCRKSKKKSNYFNANLTSTQPKKGRKKPKKRKNKKKGLI